MNEFKNEQIDDVLLNEEIELNEYFGINVFRFANWLKEIDFHQNRFDYLV